MIYKEWMKYLKDDVKITDVIMPGTHNAGSYGMTALGCCQDGTLYTQFAYGVRHFCIRFTSDKKNRIVLSHGLAKGRPLDEALQDMRKMIDENDSEFFIFDMREYYNQKIGPFSFTYPVDDKEVTMKIERFLDPQKYAFTEFERIGDVTMGDIRRSGKRYIIINYRNAYQPWSTQCEHILPWSSERHGKKAATFAKEVLSHFDEQQTDGIYWFQTQLTPGFGTENGLKTPRTLEKKLLPYYQSILDAIAANPFYLASANVISGDFMTADYSKCREIIKLNIPKRNIRDELKEEFERELNKK